MLLNGRFIPIIYASCSLNAEQSELSRKKILTSHLIYDVNVLKKGKYDPAHNTLITITTIPSPSVEECIVSTG